MEEPEAKPAAEKPEELYRLTDSALTAAQRLIRLRQYPEALRLLALATSNVQRLKALA